MVHTNAALPLQEHPIHPMNTITQFDSKNSNAIHEEAAALLAPLAEKYGIKITRAGGSIKGNCVTLKFDFTATSEESEKLQFAKDCQLFWAKPEDYGRVATINRVEVKLIGFAPNRSKFPIKCRSTGDGNVMLYTEEVLHKYFHTGRAPQPVVTNFKPALPSTT